MAIFYYDDIEQGSKEWLALRLNFITGTDAYQLLRGKSVEDILASKRTGASFSGNRATRRGHRLEPEAIYLCEQIEGVKIHHTGFITNSKHPLAGYSPDGLVSEDGLAECKAFGEDRHLNNIKRPNIEIISQIQWGMFVSERKYAYLIFYNPDLDPKDAISIKKIVRNEAVMKRFEELLNK